MGKKIMDLTGKKFHYLTVKSIYGRDKRGRIIWNCECVCGRITIARGYALKRKDKPMKSCGCMKEFLLTTYAQERWHGTGTGPNQGF